MPEDTPGEEQPTMLSFAEAAERLVKDHIAPNMTAEGLRRLARDPDSGWPIAESDYQIVRRVRLLPYEVLVPYVEERLGKRRGRGPAKRPGKKRSSPPKQQGDPVTSTDTPAVIVAVIDPKPPRYHHTGIEGDRLLITTADIPGAGKGVYFKTDPNGSSVPLAEIPALIEKLQEIAEAAGGAE